MNIGEFMYALPISVHSSTFLIGNQNEEAEPVSYSVLMIDDSDVGIKGIVVKSNITKEVYSDISPDYGTPSTNGVLIDENQGTTLLVEILFGTENYIVRVTDNKKEIEDITR